MKNWLFISNKTTTHLRFFKTFNKKCVSCQWSAVSIHPAIAKDVCKIITSKTNIFYLYFSSSLHTLNYTSIQ